jgi:hypothetical protein
VFAAPFAVDYVGVAAAVVLLDTGTFVAVAALVVVVVVDDDGRVAAATCRTSGEDRSDTGAEPEAGEGAAPAGHGVIVECKPWGTVNMCV